MLTHYYRHVDLDQALKLVGRTGFVVWYYTERDDSPDPWLDKAKRPDDAVSAVIRVDHVVDLGTPMGQLSYAGGKDPVPDPPPPPPPYVSDLVEYGKRSDVQKFFSGGRAFAV